jgi:hypothetical protein
MPDQSETSNKAEGILEELLKETRRTNELLVELIKGTGGVPGRLDKLIDLERYLITGLFSGWAGNPPPNLP